MAAANNDDTIPDAYPYYWHKASGVVLQDFLKKYKPSMVQNDGTKPWLWVEKVADREENADRDKATEEATVLLEEVTEKVESIKNDDSIPVRANKKKGTQSKKELREQVQNGASEKLKDISVRNGWVTGKWLIFAPPDKVDMIWSALAASLIEGPLAPTCAFLAKVSTCPKEETPNYQHVMCLYMPDVYDTDKVTEVMKVLLRHHGMNLMGVKSDLYTAIGLDSKHPSGIQSTVWKNSALMKEADIKALKEEFYADLNASKAAAEAAKAAEGEAAASTSDSKGKPKLKKKAVNNNPFASDDETDKPASKGGDTAASSSTKVKKPAPKKKAAVDPFGSDDEDEDEEARKKLLKAKKASASGGKLAGKKRGKSDSEDDEDPRPSKTLKGRRG